MNGAIRIGTIISFGKYEWRVLEVQNSKALIITDAIINSYHYNIQRASVTWELCTLREYLNGEFLNNFIDEDKSRIDEIRIATNNNPWFDTKGGSDTYDRVFLLSIEEVVKYFGNSGQLANSKSKKQFWIDDQFNNKRTALSIDDNKAWWWLRSPGSISQTAACVNEDGVISVRGSIVFSGSGGVRPALWLHL